MNKKKVIPQDLINKVIDSYNDGMSINKIRVALNISKRQITRILKDNNIQIRTYNVPKTDSILQAIEDYLNGALISEVTKKHNVSDTIIYKYLKKMNIEYRNEHGRKNKFNQSFFEKIDTEEKAYWLGFIYADGCIMKANAYDKKHNRLRINISLKDKELIEKFSNHIEYTGPVEIVDPKGTYANNKMIRITLNSVKMCEDLMKYGCTPNKTFSIRLPLLEQSLYPHFIRGYFDGDGSICFSKQKEKLYGNFSIIGPIEMLQDVQKVLMNQCDLNKTKLIASKTEGIVNLKYSGRNNVYRIYNYLYQDATIYLTRKKIKFSSLFSE